MAKKTSAKANTKSNSKPNPLYPSTTGEKSGKGRGNTPKQKSK